MIFISKIWDKQTDSTVYRVAPQIRILLLISVEVNVEICSFVEQLDNREFN